MAGRTNSDCEVLTAPEMWRLLLLPLLGCPPFSLFSIVITASRSNCCTLAPVPSSAHTTAHSARVMHVLLE